MRIDPCAFTNAISMSHDNSFHRGEDFALAVGSVENFQSTFGTVTVKQKHG